MLEISQRLIHKLALHIVRHPNSDSEMSVMDLIKGILCDQLSAAHSIPLPWHVFSKGGAVAAEDGSAHGRVASILHEDKGLWALTLKAKEPSYSRRRWIYHIGLREQDEAVQLYYAKCCYDHMAGSISAPKPIPESRDSLPDALFFSSHVQCLCGKYMMPVEASLLTHSTLPDFINFLQTQDLSR